MKVLFVGGTGTISSAVTEKTAREKMDLYILNRGRNNDEVPEGVKIIIGDIRDVERTKEQLKGHKFDVVVNWVAFEPEHVKADIEIFKDITKQYIFISSASCYQRPVSHYLITESTILSNPLWDYSRKKIECEDVLIRAYRETGFPVTTVRPSYTYGKTMLPFILNSRTLRWTIADRMLKGKKIIVPGDGTSLWTMTHNTDFAKGFFGLMGNIQAIGHPFHITSDEVLTWDQIAGLIGDALGVKPEIIHMPSQFISKVIKESAGGLLGDKSVSVVFDNSKIKRYVPGFTATTSFAEGIKDTVKWYMEDGDRMAIDDEFNRGCDYLIKCYEKALNEVVAYGC